MSRKTSTRPDASATLPRRLVNWLSLGLALLCAGFVVLGATGRVTVAAVRSSGMAPTIENGDRLLVTRLLPLRPEVGDMVVFNTRGIGDLGDGLLALRVAGRPGDKIELRDEKLFVNGLAAPMENRAGPIRYRSFATASYLNAFRRLVTVPEGRYFLLGDNTMASNDSRFWGFVPAENLRGNVFLRLGPASRVGRVR